MSRCTRKSTHSLVHSAMAMSWLYTQKSKFTTAVWTHYYYIRYFALLIWLSVILYCCYYCTMFCILLMFVLLLLLCEWKFCLYFWCRKDKQSVYRESESNGCDDLKLVLLNKLYDVCGGRYSGWDNLFVLMILVSTLLLLLLLALWLLDDSVAWDDATFPVFIFTLTLAFSLLDLLALLNTSLIYIDYF